MGVYAAYETDKDYRALMDYIDKHKVTRQTLGEYSKHNHVDFMKLWGDVLPDAIEALEHDYNYMVGLTDTAYYMDDEGDVNWDAIDDTVQAYRDALAAIQDVLIDSIDGYIEY